ncbi:MAG: hypothetical protein IBX40_04765 [Methanosarcinales archaeon]|nr:hypothetical protein [Methanosarcinales archaeon]
MTNIHWEWIIILPAIFITSYLLVYRICKNLGYSFIYSFVGFVLANLIIIIIGTSYSFVLRPYVFSNYYLGMAILGILTIGISTSFALGIKKFKN